MKKVPKVILLGESSVGKSSMVHVLMQGTFKQKISSTFGVCFHRYDCVLSDGNHMNIDIWDTAGQQKYRSLLGIYYKNAQGAVLVFDISDQNSFQTIKYWARQLQENGDPQMSKQLDNLGIILVGNKYDLSGQQTCIEQAKIENLLKKKPHWKFLYCSAKNDYNIETVFQTLTTMILKKQNFKKSQSRTDLSKVKQSKRKKQQRSCC